MRPRLKVRGLPLQFAPEAFAVELGEWVRFGSQPDNDLLVAILRNDLAGVIALTSDGSWSIVRATLVWLWNHAPRACWGSPENVRAWRDHGTELGELEQ